MNEKYFLYYFRLSFISILIRVIRTMVMITDGDFYYYYFFELFLLFRREEKCFIMYKTDEIMQIKCICAIESETLL